MPQQNLTSIQYNTANNYFSDANSFKMELDNPIILNCEFNNKCIGSSVSFCFEVDSNLLNENEDTATRKILRWTFEAAGIRWSLGIFPIGIDADHHGYMSIFLFRENVIVQGGISNRNARVYFSFDYDCDEVYKLDYSNGTCCGLKRWEENKCSKKRGQFVMMVAFEEFSQQLDTIFFKNVKPRNTDVLFKKPYDVEMKGDGWTYYFHSEFLSAKSIFSPTLQKDSSKTINTQMINIPDVSYNLMGSIISYITNGSIELKVDTIEKVSRVAVCLDQIDLKLSCEFMLLFSPLIKNNIVEVLSVAYNSDMKLIKKECLNIIVMDLNSIFKLPNWEIVRQSNHNVLLDITRHLALTELVTFKLDDRFCKYGGFVGNSSYILNCSKTVLHTYDVSNEELSGVIVKLTFEIPVNKLNETNIYSFQAEETKWSLRIFTNIKSKDYLSICLCNRSIGTASVDLMLDCDQDIAYFHEFSGEENWGFPKWKQTNNIKDGLLTVNFVMHQRKQDLKQTESGEKTNSVYRVCQPFNEIPHLNFISPHDVLLIGDGWEYNVHREMLTAQSPVFAAMFSHDTKENKEKSININDISSVTMKAILSFIYTGRIEICDETVIDICAAADKYFLDSIKSACEHVLCNLTVKTVSERYICAEMYNLAILKSTCIRFIMKNLKAVTQTEGWVHLTKQPTLTEKLLLSLNVTAK